ncbi:MAG TPA: O-antigen ligase family protein, partial [Sphingomicrobium sp.]|nr:O-antigen ligase family protein [Sphingomicrobium sp.]
GFLLLRSDTIIALLRRTWPLFLLPCLAFLSMAWSPDPFTTFRKAVAFLGTILLGLAIAERLSYAGAIRLIGQVALAMVIFSIVWAFVFPHLAIHQVTDAWPYQKTHAGSWRGVFAHKTMLGYMSGLALALVVYYGPLVVPQRLLRVALILLTAWCLIMANSGGGFLTAAGLLGLFYLLGAVSRLDRLSRLAMISFAAAAALVVGYFANDIVTAVLALLGKKPDLTGRLPYWLNLFDILNERPFLGYGYYAGFAYDIGIKLAQTTGTKFSSPHNGYLSVIASFGYVGLTVALFMLAWLGGKSIRIVMRAGPEVSRFSIFPLAVVVYALGANMIEDSLSSGNEMVVMLLAVVGGLVSQGIPFVRSRPPSTPQPIELAPEAPILVAGRLRY